MTTWALNSPPQPGLKFVATDYMENYSLFDRAENSTSVGADWAGNSTGAEQGVRCMCRKTKSLGVSCDMLSQKILKIYVQFKVPPNTYSRIFKAPYLAEISQYKF